MIICIVIKSSECSSGCRTGVDGGSRYLFLGICIYWCSCSCCYTDVEAAADDDSSMRAHSHQCKCCVRNCKHSLRNWIKCTGFSGQC